MFSVLTVMVLALTGVTAELSGRVVDASDRPIEGAIVVVSTAKPRLGPATTCPSCYRDCTKRTLTDKKGVFSIKGLSSELLFSLASGGAGYQGEISEYFDPASDPKIVLQLTAMPKASETDFVSGRVVDGRGQPMSGVEVHSRNIFRSTGIGGGNDATVTPLTLTDSRGQFQLSVGDHIESIDLRASTSGYAPVEAHWDRTQAATLTIEMGRGASIRGTLVLGDAPVAGVELGLVQKNRMLGSIVTPRELHTDPSGQFLFEQLPPGLEYTIYTHHDQAAEGVLPVSLIEAPGDDEIADLGAIPASPPQRLSVTVTTTDGSKLPKDSYVYFGRSYAWRGTRLMLQQQSTSKVTLIDVASEVIQVVVRTPGYTVIKTQPSLNIDLNQNYSVDTRRESAVVFVVEPN